MAGVKSTTDASSQRGNIAGAAYRTLMVVKVNVSSGSKADV